MPWSTAVNAPSKLAARWPAVSPFAPPMGSRLGLRVAVYTPQQYDAPPQTPLADRSFQYGSFDRSWGLLAYQVRADDLAMGIGALHAALALLGSAAGG